MVHLAMGLSSKSDWQAEVDTYHGRKKTDSPKLSFDLSTYAAGACTHMCAHAQTRTNTHTHKQNKTLSETHSVPQRCTPTAKGEYRKGPLGFYIS